jgi:pimeloyl-ACP methyl ester carboxylesterase
MEDMSNDVARFMHENKISTATLAGHGFGGKLALAFGCYHLDRVTGVMCVDTAPIDHRYFESFKEFKSNISKAKEIDLKTWSNKEV